MSYQLDLPMLKSAVVEKGSTDKGKFVLSVANNLQDCNASKWFFFMNCEGDFECDITRCFTSLIKKDGDDFSTVFRDSVLDDFWVAVIFEKECKKIFNTNLKRLYCAKIRYEDNKQAWDSEVRGFAFDKFSSIMVNYFQKKACEMHEESKARFNTFYSPKMDTVKYHYLKLPELLKGAVYEYEHSTGGYKM